MFLVNDDTSVFEDPQDVHAGEAEIYSPQHPRLLCLNDIEEHEYCVEQVVPALGQTVDVSLVDELVVRGSGAALVDAEEALLGNIRFVWGVAEVLRSESLPIWVLWVRGQSGVQVCTKHMHEDSTVSGEVCVPLPVLQITATIPAKGAHAAAVGQLLYAIH